MTVSRDSSIDALLPAEMALRAEKIGVSKAHMSVFTMFALGILAGIFIALGAIFATTVTAPTMDVDPATGAQMALDIHRDECPLGKESESLSVAARQLVLIEKYLQKFLSLDSRSPRLYAEVDFCRLVEGLVPNRS